MRPYITESQNPLYMLTEHNYQLKRPCLTKSLLCYPKAKGDTVGFQMWEISGLQGSKATPGSGVFDMKPDTTSVCGTDKRLSLSRPSWFLTMKTESTCGHTLQVSEC